MQTYYDFKPSVLLPFKTPPPPDPVSYCHLYSLYSQCCQVLLDFFSEVVLPSFSWTLWSDWWLRALSCVWGYNIFSIIPQRGKCTKKKKRQYSSISSSFLNLNEKEKLPFLRLFFFFFFKYRTGFCSCFIMLVICLFMAVLGLHCCMQAFSSCSVHFLTAVASLAVKQGLQGTGFSSCSTWAPQLWLTGLIAPRHWDLLGQGIKPVSSALQGQLLATGPPGKPYWVFFLIWIH